MEIAIKRDTEKVLEDTKCPICHSSSWIVNSNATAKFPVNNKFEHMQGEGFLSVEATCECCGFIASFNLDVILKRFAMNEKR